MTDASTETTLTPEQQARADRFVQLLVLTRTLKGGDRPTSRRWMGRQLDVSPTMMNRYEHGRVDPAEVRFGVVDRLAKVLGVSISAVSLYLLQGKTQGLLEHPFITPVAHLLTPPPQPLPEAPSSSAATEPDWMVQLQALPETTKGKAALQLMQLLSARLLALGGATVGRQVLLAQMTAGLKTRAQQKLHKQFDQQLSGLMQGKLPLETKFWTAIAPALENGETPEALLAGLGAIAS